MKRCLAKITTCYNVEILAQHFLAVPSALRSLQPGCLEGTEPGTFAGDPLLGAMGIECRMVEYQSRRGFLSPASARFRSEERRVGKECGSLWESKQKTAYEMPK